jgi:hypothetical protein
LYCVRCQSSPNNTGLSLRFCHLWNCTEPFSHVIQYCVRHASEILLLFIKVSSYYHQLALSQATGDKGPTGPGAFPPDPFQYLQAQVGPVGPRGPPGMISRLERSMVSVGGWGSQPFFPSSGA